MDIARILSAVAVPLTVSLVTVAVQKQSHAESERDRDKDTVTLRVPRFDALLFLLPYRISISQIHDTNPTNLSKEIPA